jgi:enoyl-CoA hydratase/carnithine racemase
MWDILGRSKTVEMILGGGFLSAQEAKERDLVSKVVPFARP